MGQINGKLLEPASLTDQLTIPTLRVRRSGSQSINASQWENVEFNAKDWDTHNYYDTTNYRLQPTAPGKFLITLQIDILGMTADQYLHVAIFKNGSLYSFVIRTTSVAGSQPFAFSDMVELNGTTDYVEGRVWTDQSTPSVRGDTGYTSMSASRIST